MPPRATAPKIPGMTRGKGPTGSNAPSVNHGSTPCPKPSAKVSHSKSGKDSLGMNKGNTYTGPAGQKSTETQKALVAGTAAPLSKGKKDN